MEQTNKKGIGISLLSIFGLIILNDFFIYYNPFHLPSLIQFIIFPFFTFYKVKAIVDILIAVSFVFLGSHNKWFKSVLGQVCCFTLSLIFLYYAFCILFNPPIDHCVNNLSGFTICIIEDVILLSAWIGLFLTLKINSLTKIFGLLLSTFNFLGNTIFSYLIFSNSIQLNKIVTFEGFVYFNRFFLYTLLLLFTILWICKKETSIQQN